jgi:hypothetical protein
MTNPQSPLRHSRPPRWAASCFWRRPTRRTRLSASRECGLCPELGEGRRPSGACVTGLVCPGYVRGQTYAVDTDPSMALPTRRTHIAHHCIVQMQWCKAQSAKRAQRSANPLMEHEPIDCTGRIGRDLVLPISPNEQIKGERRCRSGMCGRWNCRSSLWTS